MPGGVSKLQQGKQKLQKQDDARKVSPPRVVIGPKIEGTIVPNRNEAKGRNLPAKLRTYYYILILSVREG